MTVPRRWSDFLQRMRGDGRDAERQRWLAILQLNRHLAEAQGRAAVLTILVDDAVRLFGAERGFLIRVVDGGGFRVEVARSFDREPIAQPQRKVSSTILQRVLEQGEGIFSEDAQSDSLTASQSVADLRLRSVLCMPLRAGGQVLGLLYLDHRFQAGAFGERDLPWLMAFADQGAIVLHLHGLLDENREQARRLAEQNRSLQETVAAQARALAEPAVPGRDALRHPFPGLVGDSPALLRALHVLDRVAETELPVLLTGESGTGKELAARALHRGSRRTGQFVAVNVAAIAGELLASELFGHTRGAFTGADRERPGLLRQAAGGTLFLDEVTEMDLELQAKLLRALEQRAVRPVGSDREFAIDARIVAATNRDPRRAIAEGRLREDLYFRLAVVTVHLPPLRERGDDVLAIAASVLAQLAEQRGVAPVALDAAMAQALCANPWPGNVRQLRNELQRVWALADGGPLRPELLTPPSSSVPGAPVDAAGAPPLCLADLERWAIERALERAGGNKAEAARLLGIGRRTLYDKLSSRPDA
ncbi:MAG: sigma-54-dependent Fis family transcriptional regulator [Planctomycetes bacterium]|nr:sigma-54-dependent Fis family transcriptional regulator [Planctomycetota bacterium]